MHARPSDTEPAGDFRRPAWPRVRLVRDLAGMVFGESKHRMLGTNGAAVGSGTQTIARRTSIPATVSRALPSGADSQRPHE
jgi:hypothetical protein